MQVTTKAIVLSSLKYGDNSLIVKAFTKSDGIKSYLLKGVLSSKKGKLKAAYFLPLMQLDLVAYHKNKGTLERIRETKVANVYKSLHTDVIKNSLVLFLSEVLTSCLQEQEADTGLYNYLEYSLDWLDQHSEIANFHLLFLLNLTKFLGFYPDISYSDSDYFDLQEGNFVAVPTLNPMIGGDNIQDFKKLLGINFDSLQNIKMSKKKRHELLQFLIVYFQLHLHGFKKPRSLSVLKAVFD